MTEAWVVRRDGEVKHIELGSYYDVVGWMHGHTTCSVDHATRYEGWRIATEEVIASLDDAALSVAVTASPGRVIDLNQDGVTINGAHSLAYPFTQQQLEALVEQADELGDEAAWEIMAR